MNFAILTMTSNGEKCRFFQKIPQPRFDETIKPLLVGKPGYEVIFIEEREFPQGRNRECSERWRALCNLPVALAEAQGQLYFADPVLVLRGQESIARVESLTQMAAHGKQAKAGVAQGLARPSAA